MRGDARLRAACGLFLSSLVIFSHAGPVDRVNRIQALRLGNDQPSAEVSELQISVIPQNTTITGIDKMTCVFGKYEYDVGEIFSGSSPCEQCSCTESGVVCERTPCYVQAGCKAIHKADRCCPIYQCECEQNGTIYSNGEKLVDPENPCQVCYCQGGDIVCNKIACFRRDDCEPRYVTGRCCPEYDHCPPRDTDIENRVHSKESTQKRENDKIETTSQPIEDKIITKPADEKPADNLTSENNQDEVGGIFRNGDYLSDIDGNSPPVNNNREALRDNKVKNTNNSGQRQTINIKEVTQDKSFNNEIRIKEVLPMTNFDVASFSTKSPTIPREVSYAKESEEAVEKINIPKSSKGPESKISSNEAFPTPPVLRIGDQLLFLKLGDLVPENGTLSTPSSVFTVIGAEGLQRVEDDPEEMFDNKDDIKKDDFSGDVMTDGREESDMSENVTSHTDLQSNDTIINTSQNENKVTSIIISEDFINNNVTDDPDKILQDVISELYASTTAEPQVKVSEESSEEEKDNLLFNTINNTKISENNYESTEITSKENDQSTEDPLTTVEKSTPDQSSDEEQQPIDLIPIEHLPEHNPEYPPIPEDIMVLTMTEDSLESGSSEMEFSGGSPIDSQEMKFNEKTPPVKRPALLGPTKQNKNNNVEKDLNPVKILPDVLELVRPNKTNETNNGVPLIPEDWLKSNEENKQKDGELNSPLLALSSALPDIILQADFKDSSEEDETKIYIFVNNDTLNANSVNLNQPEEVITEESIISTTELTEPEPEYRSPGEPHLIPEWERNQTTTEIPEDSSENIEIDQTEDPFSLMTTLFDTSDQAEVMNEASLIQMNKEINTTPNDENSSNEITPLLDYSTEYVRHSSIQDSLYRASSSATFIIENEKDSSLEPSNDVVTNPVTTTTEKSTQATSGLEAAAVSNTEKNANFHTDTEFVQNYDSYVNGAHTKKQKKTASLLTAEIKNDNSNELTKKGNILADLINLVGDVAAMGTHDAEVSTVSNNIDVPKYTESPKREEINHLNQLLTVKPLSTTAKTTTTQENKNLEEYVTVEFSEFTPSIDKIDGDIPIENEKVEVTTKKTYIDKDGDERNTWKSTDYIVKDIEIIPKVANKVPKKNSSLERIITKENSKNNVDSAFTTQQIKKVTTLSLTTSAPQIMIKKEKNEKFIVDEKKNSGIELVKQLRTIGMNVSTTTQSSLTIQIEDKLDEEETVSPNNNSEELVARLNKIIAAQQALGTFKTEEKTVPDLSDQKFNDNQSMVTQLKEVMPTVQITSESSIIQMKEEKSKNVVIVKTSEESLTKEVKKPSNKVKATAPPRFVEKSSSNGDVIPNTQAKKVLKNGPATTLQPLNPISKENPNIAIANNKTNTISKLNIQSKKLVTIAPMTIKTTTVRAKGKSEINPINVNEDVIIYTTMKPTSTFPVMDTLKTDTEAVKEIKHIPDPKKAVLAPVPKKDTVNLESVQRPPAQQVTTESAGATSTVMKVSSRIQNEENTPENISDDARDKLTKRETNSQLTDATGQIDESLISIMRDFFEKQYRH